MKAAENKALRAALQTIIQMASTKHTLESIHAFAVEAQKDLDDGKHFDTIAETIHHAATVMLKSRHLLPDEVLALFTHGSVYEGLCRLEQITAKERRHP